MKSRKRRGGLSFTTSTLIYITYLCSCRPKRKVLLSACSCDNTAYNYGMHYHKICIWNLVANQSCTPKKVMQSVPMYLDFNVILQEQCSQNELFKVSKYILNLASVHSRMNLQPLKPLLRHLQHQLALLPYRFKPSFII